MLPFDQESYLQNRKYARALYGVGAILPSSRNSAYFLDTTPSSTKYLDISMARQLAHAFMMDVARVIPFHKKF